MSKVKKRQFDKIFGQTAEVKVLKNKNNQYNIVLVILKNKVTNRIIPTFKSGEALAFDSKNDAYKYVEHLKIKNRIISVTSDEVLNGF